MFPPQRVGPRVPGVPPARRARAGAGAGRGPVGRPRGRLRHRAARAGCYTY